MRTIFAIAFLISIFSCSSKKNVTGNSSHAGSEPKTSLRVAITAFDLSEDGARFYTKNDEVVILSYIVPDDTNSTPTLIGSNYFVFDSLNRSMNFMTDSFAQPQGGKFCVALIEMDDDKTKEQVEPVMRLNFRKINDEFENHDLVGLQTYLGDNDLLGIIYLSTEKQKVEKENPAFITGQHLFDTYKYELNFKLTR
jgi:hypothetical protein